MMSSKYFQHVLIAVAAAVSIGATESRAALDDFAKGKSIASKADAAVRELSKTVKSLSHPKALETAFRGYYTYKAAHPEDVKKPFLYFVDFGKPNTQPRGYVFDMENLRVVDGPFTVAHGRGSRASNGVPTRFSNRPGSEATSLGLYVAGQTYTFNGKSGGRHYQSVGLRLQGVSSNYNDRAFARGVVAHGAPYVTSNRAGMSEGCPAMEPQRARRLLPQLAEGSLVFLFAPDSAWMANDPWASSAAVATTAAEGE